MSDSLADRMLGSCRGDTAFGLEQYSREVRSLEQQLAEAQAAALCSVCVGSPISDKPCICGGTGKVTDEAQGLREALYNAQAEIVGVKSDLHEMDKENDRLLDENSNLQKCCDERGARMQIMRRALEGANIEHIGDIIDGWSFVVDVNPPAKKWFDKDGVPK